MLVLQRESLEDSVREDHPLSRDACGVRRFPPRHPLPHANRGDHVELGVLIHQRPNHTLYIIHFAKRLVREKLWIRPPQGLGQAIDHLLRDIAYQEQNQGSACDAKIPANRVGSSRALGPRVREQDRL